jgi:hypothetical protein
MCLPDGSVCEMFAGVIDEVRVYNRELTDTEVINLYHYSGAPNQPPAIWSQPAGQNLYTGDTTQLSIGATGTWPVTFQWQDGVSSAGAITTR